MRKHNMSKRVFIGAGYGGVDFNTVERLRLRAWAMRGKQKGVMK